MALSLTNRELYIKSIFLPPNKSTKKEYLSEDEVNKIVKEISSIGERYGFIGGEESKNEKKSSQRKHKYDVWIAKEIKKNMDLLNQFNKIRFILDWAIQTRSDIFSYSFEDAFLQQNKWHEELFKKYDIKNLEIKEIDNDRVLYRCSDKNHFLYLLTSDELTYEGQEMGMCVGGDHYKQKVKNERSIIISLRDKNNLPHVTTEIDIQSGDIIQISGKGNGEPATKYKKMLLEFILFATNYENIENGNLAHLLNLQQTL